MSTVATEIRVDEFLSPSTEEQATQFAMLPFLWLAVSPRVDTPIDKIAVTELHLTLAALLHHGEPVNMFVISRPAKFSRLEVPVPPQSTFTFTLITFVH